MTQARVTRQTLAVLHSATPAARVTRAAVASLSTATPAARVTRGSLAVLNSHGPNSAKVTSVSISALAGGDVITARVSRAALAVLHAFDANRARVSRVALQVLISQSTGAVYKPTKSHPLRELLGLIEVRQDLNAPSVEQKTVVIAGDAEVVDDPSSGSSSLRPGETLLRAFQERIITPAALSANADDWSPTDIDVATVVLVSASTPVTITGKTGTAPLQVWINVGAQTITLAHESGSSTADNRFRIPGGSPLDVDPDEAVWILRDTVADRFVVRMRPL